MNPPRRDRDRERPSDKNGTEPPVPVSRYKKFRSRVLREIRELRADVKQLVDLHTQEKTQWERWWGYARLAGLLGYRATVVVGFGALFAMHPELAKAITGIVVKLIP